MAGRHIPFVARDPDQLVQLPSLRVARRQVARLRLERVHGTFDGLERISTQMLMDLLEVSQHDRTAGAYRHLATLMTELGWTAVRVRDLTRGRYKEQVRGYVRRSVAGP